MSIILVDTSYTSFYRFFATIRWYSYAHPEEFKELKDNVEYNWYTNTVFIEKYEKMYLDQIIKLIGKKIFSKAMVIFCMDSPKANLWRTTIDCDYKGNRADMSLKYNFKPTFEYTYNSMIPKFTKMDNIHSIVVPKMEADDIIASITMYLNKTNINQEIYIVSGDEDFLQLGRKSVTFVNYKIKKPFSLSEELAAIKLKIKLIMGDKSDCIKGIFPKGSRVKKQELIESEEKLEEYLASNIEARTQYEFNKKMIDFKNIPVVYINKVVKIFEKL